MDRKKKERYLLAVYTVVLLLSIVLIFVGLQIEKPDLKSIILNISTELFAIVLIFFVINKAFMVDQWNAEEKIELLTKTIENSKKSSSIDFFEEKINLSSSFKESKTIEICGVTLNTDLNANLILFKDKIIKGHDIKLMFIDPNSLAPKMTALRSVDGVSEEYYKKKLDIVFNGLEYLTKITSNLSSEKKSIGKIEVRLLQYSPSFSINRLTNKSGEQEIIIELYSMPHKVGYDSPPMFRLCCQKDKKWFKYFSEQYDAMWDSAKIWKFTEKD